MGWEDGGSGLASPGFRQELILHLRHLADPKWFLRALQADPPYDEDLDEILDFFDDMGVVDKPRASIGTILFDEQEAEVMGRIGAQLKSILSESTVDPRVELLPDPANWEPMLAVVREALNRLTSREV